MVEYKIVVTNEKGGTGKSTVAVLLVEYLNFQNQQAFLLDIDPIHTAQNWVEDCLQEGRQVSFPSAPIKIIDTAGTSGSALAWLKEADLIVVPFQSHYADLSVVINWFTSLNSGLQSKIYFLPNRWQNTKEQREGLEQLRQIIQEEKRGKLLPHLTNRPALYGALLNGSKENFFNKKKIPEETIQLMQRILKQVE